MRHTISVIAGTTGSPAAAMRIRRRLRLRRCARAIRTVLTEARLAA